MAIAYVSSSISTTGNTTGKTWSYTIGSGSNRLLIVSFWHTTTGTDIVTGVTYNSVAMTRIDSKQYSSSREYVYYMLEANLPSAGTYDVVVSMSTNGYSSGGAASYTGVKQAAYNVSNTGADGSDDLAISATLTASGWLIGGYGNDSAGGWTNSANATLRTSTGGGDCRTAIYDSNSLLASGSQTLTCNNTAGASMGVIAAFEEAVAPGPANVKTFQGVAKASTKTLQGVAIASVKSSQGVV